MNTTGAPNATVYLSAPVESDREAYRFDDRGLVQSPGQLILVSAVDETITSVVRVGP